MTEGGTIRQLLLSYLSTAAGKIELSRSVTSQIGTAQPTKEVILRVNASATAGNVTQRIDVNIPVKAFDYLYIHQTGTGNLGSATLS